MFKKFLIATAMLFSCSTTVFAQADRSASEGGGFIGAYRTAVNHPTRGVCTAPQCRVVRPRQMPTGETEQAEAVQFLVAGARACLVDCSCEVQDAATPRYCVTEATPPSRPAPAATPAPAPAPRQVATPAPVAVTPVTPPVVANPPLPPFMPQGMFGGQSYAEIGYCGPTAQTISAFQQIGLFDGIWYSSGARPQMMSLLAGQPAAAAMQNFSHPMTVEFSFEPTPYVMVISVNRREVLAFENGQALTSVHQTRNGGYCVRGAIPAGTNGTFSMQVEGNSTVINLEVSCYLPTPSGVIGAPVSTKRFPYSLPATMQANRPITIDQFDCGI